jgi:hypothetical protein
MTRTTAALAIAVAITGSAFLTDSASAQSHCNGLSGHYGNVTAITVGPDGKTVSIIMANDRPLAYGLCTPDGKLNINFKSPDENLQGQFDGKVIRWSNNSTWTKQPMCWVGGPADKPACK